MNGSDQAFPSVYLLRGDEREWANPRQDNHREGRSALVVADDLVRAGRMRRNEEPWHSNYLRSRYLLRLLEARGHRNGFGQLVLRGSRLTWFWADEHLARSLRRHEALIRAA